MIDIINYQYDGINVLTYGLLTLTTCIIAFATLADSGSGDSVVGEMTENIIQSVQNPSELLEMNPVEMADNGGIELNKKQNGGSKKNKSKKMKNGKKKTRKQWK